MPARHEKLAALLAACTDDELADTGQYTHVGVGGGSTVVDVDGTPVFVKRIPLTDRELANPRSTANLFDVPTFCQYGVGSPGFNAWRELAANIIVTDAALERADLPHRLRPGHLAAVRPVARRARLRPPQRHA